MCDRQLWLQMSAQKCLVVINLEISWSIPLLHSSHSIFLLNFCFKKICNTICMSFIFLNGEITSKKIMIIIMVYSSIKKFDTFFTWGCHTCGNTNGTFKSHAKIQCLWCLQISVSTKVWIYIAPVSAVVSFHMSIQIKSWFFRKGHQIVR